MRILYVAKHGPYDNQDEDAIAYALEKLGHDVVKVHELRRHRTTDLYGTLMSQSFDFCLFHKWETVSELAEVARYVPCAFWYFDLISNDDDPTLAARMQQRRRWFNDVAPHCVVACCTDGDWVERWNEGGQRGRRGVDPCPAFWLMQGADERFVGLGEPRFKPAPDILFTGTRHHGRKREEHVAELEARYGSRFSVLGDTRGVSRKHGRELADLFASVKVVVAPDGPCTDRYWSNRVYLTLGLGGCLVHPWCEGLGTLRHYTRDWELTCYDNREGCFRHIDALLANDVYRNAIRERALYATVQRNLYRHRCQDLIRIMEGVL